MYKKGKIHRKIDMSILPHHKSLIDWKNSVGYDVPFEYDNITGFITIVKWISAKDLIVSYNNQEFHISGKDICSVKLGKILGITVVSQIMKIDRVTISRYLNEMIRSEYLNETEVREKQLQNKIDQHYQLDSKPVFCIEEQLAFGSYSKVKEFLEPRVTKKFSCGSFCQGLSRINGTSYGYHWKRMTREEFNLYKTQNPEKAFGDYFINTE